MSNIFECECIGASMRRPRNGVRVAIVLTFELPDGHTATVWFNADPAEGKKRNKQCRLKINGTATKLYRLATGNEPSRRNEGCTLMRHLIGILFFIEVDGTHHSTGEMKAINVRPVEPYSSSTWTETGMLKQKSHPNLGLRKTSTDQHENIVNTPYKHRKDDVNIPYNDRKHSLGNPHSYLASPTISTTNNLSPVTNSQTPIVNAIAIDVINKQGSNEFVYVPTPTLTEQEADEISIATPIVDFTSMRSEAQTYFEQRDDYETWLEQVSDTEYVFHYHQKPREIDDDYLDRILNESVADWTSDNNEQQAAINTGFMR